MTHAYQNAIVLAACFLNEPVGVIIADRKGKGSSAELCYLFVRKKYRRLGIASLLLQSLEDRLIDQDCQWLTVRYIKDENSLPLKQWLERSGFSSEATDMHIFRGSLLPEYRNLPFIRMSQLPKSFTIFPWRTLSDTERDQLRKGENQWYPDYLSPFKEAYKVDMKTSVGLKYRSEVVGWLITHKTPVHALEYAKLFTRREFQFIRQGHRFNWKSHDCAIETFSTCTGCLFSSFSP